MGKKAATIPSQIGFTNEPRGEVYIRLIDLAQRQGDMFSLVWHEDRGNNRLESEIGRRLEPFVLSDIITCKWPGTFTFPYPGNLCTYQLNQDTGKVLKTLEGLYDWLAPDFPEDLNFYIDSGDVWLTSVAHECTGWINRASIRVHELKSLLSFLYHNRIIEEKCF